MSLEAGECVTVPAGGRLREGWPATLCRCALMAGLDGWRASPRLAEEVGGLASVRLAGSFGRTVEPIGRA